jgi:thioredoxin-related protein
LPLHRSANVERYAVLVLSTKCRFCARDADFYRQLSARRDARHRLIAVFPAGELEARTYLQRLGIVVDEVVDSDLSRFGASATPTVIVADGDRKVSKAWVGALAGDSRADVLSSLTCASCGS